VCKPATEYASTIDPNSEADSGVLVVLAQLTSWMLFLAFGMEASRDSRAGQEP